VSIVLNSFQIELGSIVGATETVIHQNTATIWIYGAVLRELVVLAEQANLDGTFVILYWLHSLPLVEEVQSWN